MSRKTSKREIYERMNPRRRKFVDRIGYDNWDPFQKPNEPLDMRTDVSKRTTQQLVNEFLRDAAKKGPYGKAYSKGATECARMAWSTRTKSTWASLILPMVL